MYKAGGHDSLHRRLESESILVRFEFVKKNELRTVQNNIIADFLKIFPRDLDGILR